MKCLEIETNLKALCLAILPTSLPQKKKCEKVVKDGVSNAAFQLYSEMGDSDFPVGKHQLERPLKSDFPTGKPRAAQTTPNRDS